MLEISSERSTTLILPLPIDLLAPFLDKGTGTTELTDGHSPPELRHDPVSGRWVVVATCTGRAGPARHKRELVEEA